MNLIKLEDWSTSDIIETVDNAISIKSAPKNYVGAMDYHTLTLLFQKTSTRTRCAGEIGMMRLGGNSSYLDWRSTNFALADFIAPEGQHIDDYIGGFVVTSGPEVEARAKRLEQADDDYGSIMLKALADRLAEAQAEYLHRRVRTSLWGYAPQEVLANTDLIRESYRGIRPAPGYPACPDHTEKFTLFQQVLKAYGHGIKRSIFILG